MIKHKVGLSSDEILYVWKKLGKAEKEVGFWPNYLEGYCDYFSYKKYLDKKYLEENMSRRKKTVKGWTARLRGYNRIVSYRNGTDY